MTAPLMITRHDERRPYCFDLDELTQWLDGELVRDRRWTQLDARRWRLDGFAYNGKEHTVWVFELKEDGVELAEYKDSEKAELTPDNIMHRYYPRISYLADDQRRRFPHCKDPYD